MREMNPDHSQYVSRRRFLQTIGMASMASWAVPLLVDSAPQANAEELSQDPTSNIRHIIVSCQENHSLDHYYGYYSKIGDHGVPLGWKDHIKPYHLQTLEPPDPRRNNWKYSHVEWDSGKMDGFYQANGRNALGYYLQEDLPGYYSLLPQFTLCANYFCGVLSSTSPNRLVLYSGTCGGCTTNNVANGQLDYPCIADLLQRQNLRAR